MDWTALGLSLRLGLVTVVLLLPLSFLLARWLAFGRFRGRGLQLSGRNIQRMLGE